MESDELLDYDKLNRHNFGRILESCIILLNKVCLLHVTRTHFLNAIGLFLDVEDGGGVKLKVVHEVHK